MEEKLNEAREDVEAKEFIIKDKIREIWEEVKARAIRDENARQWREGLGSLKWRGGNGE